MSRQCSLLELPRSSFYCQPWRDTTYNEILMRLLDEEYTRHPFYGVRRMTGWLVGQGYPVNEKRVRRLLRLMGILAIYPRPRLSGGSTDSERYPSDGYPMALRLECFNSVDGSTRFRALMGWFRFVCSNGLIIGVTYSDMCRRHVGDLRLSDSHSLFTSGMIGEVLASGLGESEAEKKNLDHWYNIGITLNQIVSWVDNDLQKEWGFKAAARAYHIARFGADGDIIEQLKGKTPTTIAMEKTKLIPGAPQQCNNLYDLSQILAWLAKERRDVQEQLEWREKIPKLMKP